MWIGAETGEIARYRHGEFASWPRAGGAIISFYQARTGLIWRIRLGLRPLRFAPEQPDKVEALTAAHGLPDEWCSSVCEDRESSAITTATGKRMWQFGGHQKAVGTLNGVVTTRR